MNIQLYKEHHYHYFLENLFFSKMSYWSPTVWMGGLALSDLAQILCETWVHIGNQLVWWRAWSDYFSTLHHHPGNPPPPCVMPEAQEGWPLAAPPYKNHNCKNAANFRKPISIYIKEDSLGQLKNILTTVPYYTLFLNLQE